MTRRSYVPHEETLKATYSGRLGLERQPASVRDALESTLASLESVMAHYGPSMPEADRAGRERVLAEGYAALIAEDATP